MDDPVLEQQWTSFMEGGGTALDAEINETLKTTAHLLAMNDGTPASWHDGHLGVLLVFGGDDVASLMGAWEASEQGNLLALNHMLEWCGGLIDFITHCTGFED